MGVEFDHAVAPELIEQGADCDLYLRLRGEPPTEEWRQEFYRAASEQDAVIRVQVGDNWIIVRLDGLDDADLKRAMRHADDARKLANARRAPRVREVNNAAATAATLWQNFPGAG